MNLSSAILALAISTVILSTHAMAGTRSLCGPQKKIIKSLQDDYQESQNGLGIDSKGRIVQFFVSKEKRTYTFLETSPNGQTCIISVGGYWGFSKLKSNDEEM